MRVLFLTNFYPPYEIGGEEQSCYDAAQALRARGHVVTVLTSTHGRPRQRAPEDGVCRDLYLEMELNSPLHPWRFFLQRHARERATLGRLRQVVGQTAPDVVFIWGMWNLPRSVPALAEALRPGRVLYRFGDYWPTLPSQHEMYWLAPGRRWTRPIKKLLAAIALAQLRREKLPVLGIEHAYCISAAMRQELVDRGAPVEHARIIHNGLDTDRFHPGPRQGRPPESGQPLALLYAGRLVADKGVDTAIAAMGHLVQRQETPVHLALAGGGDPAYVAQLQRQMREAQIEAHVSFLGRQPKERMPDLLRDYDVLLFPSVWPEPFGRSIIEAMASELAVLCTPVGGVPEIVTDGQEGLFFAPGDAADLSARIAQLVDDPALARRLGQAGRQTVLARFTLQRTIDQIETLLSRLAD
jgi:glycosyltransferase involved in cell wall biosynthesis